MFQLIITLDEKRPLVSTETSSGKWEIYFHKEGQRDRLEEKYFHAYDMEKSLNQAIDELKKKRALQTESF